MSDTDLPMRRYYAARAPEYDRVYQKPERQADLRALRQWLPPRFLGRRVLEVACGTGYWTELIAPVASSMVAVDAAPETLRLAGARVASGRVEFVEGDAYALPNDRAPFTGAFAGFWFSHVPRRRRRAFLQDLGARLAPGARVVLLDNRFVDGSSTPLAEQDGEGNTYQRRGLGDGSSHLVLKNFPAEAELLELVAGVGTAATYTAFTHYWALEYAAARP